MSNLVRSQPISFGLRGALGFGIVFALTVPIGSLIYDKLFFRLDAFVSHLRVAYFEPRFAWLLWLPAIFNTIVGGLVFGLVVAILFADRDQRRKYFFYGAFGWFMYQAVITALTSHSFWELLSDTQVVYFSLLIRALVGAIFGMILVISSSERSHTMRWLVACLIGLPLFAWLSMYQLINGSAFPTPWRVAGVFTLILGMIVIVLAVTRKLDDKGRSWIASAGMLAFPVAVILSSGIYLLIFPNVPRYTSTIDMFHLATSSAFRGALFGLLLGIIMGFQSRGKLPVFLFSN